MSGLTRLGVSCSIFPARAVDGNRDAGTTLVPADVLPCASPRETTVSSRTAATDAFGIAPPAPRGRTLLLAALAFAGGMALTAWLDYDGREAFAGHLQAHTVSIAAPHDGPIQSIDVVEGQSVAPHEKLLTMANGHVQSALDEQQRQVAALADELRQAVARAEVDLAWRTRQLDDDILETRLRSSSLLRERFSRELEGVAWGDLIDGESSAFISQGTPFQWVIYELSQPAPERMRGMLAEEQARNAAEVYSAQLKLCEDRLGELQTLKRELPAKVYRANGVEVARTRLEQAQARLNLLQQQAESTLTAPNFGTVGIFRKRAGDRVTAGEPIVDLLDNDRRFVVAMVSSQCVSQFAPGAEVAVRFPGGEQRRGHVVHVPPQTAGVSDVSQRDSDALVPVRIERVGRLWPQLPIGAAVSVSPAG